MSALQEKLDDVALTCSFCGKSQHKVGWLIAGPVANICDECIDLCAEIVHDKRMQFIGEREYRSWFATT